MPFKPKIKIALVKCGNCGRSYNNPMGHTCVVRASRSAAGKSFRSKTAKKKGSK